MEQLLQVGFNPKQLGLEESDPVVERLAQIASHFDSLCLTIFDVPAEIRDEIYTETPVPPLLRFEYGVHYFFGKNQGRPRSVRENAAAAIFEGEQGVELWRIMRSNALTAPGYPLVITHTRADRELDFTKLAQHLDVSESDLKRADVTKLGLEYGTVNPFTQTDIPIRHFFDRDLITGADYPYEDTVFSSSGDPRFYVGFDIRRYLKGIQRLPIQTITPDISKPEETRVIARRPIIVVGGDSGRDTAHFTEALMNSLITALGKNYFGDRSFPEIYPISDPKLSGSIDTNLYGQSLKAHMPELMARAKALPRERRIPPIITFSSTAMHGGVGKLLEQEPGIDYIDPKQAVRSVLAELAEHQIEVAHTILLGLPSVYNSSTSAFEGHILEGSIAVNSETQEKVQQFIINCKSNTQDFNQFYQVIENLLREQGKLKGEMTTLLDKNVVVILAASELEGFISRYHSVAKPFTDIKSSKVTTIIDELNKVGSGKIRLIYIFPGQTLIEKVVEKDLEPIY